MLLWEKIHGFTSPGEHKSFVQYIEEQVASGMAKEQPADPVYGKGMIYGGQGFKILKREQFGGWCHRTLLSADFGNQ
jgi:hypothetical protein